MTRRPPLPRKSAPTLSHKTQYLFGAVLLALLGRLPRFAKEPTARLIGRIWYHLFPIRRKVVLENLKRAFPGRDASWRGRTARKCLAHFVHMMVFDFQEIRRHKKKALRELMAEVQGIEHLQKARADGKPFILVSAHLGNWELGASYLTAVEKCQVQAVVKPLHNPLFEKVLSESRSAYGWSTISTRKNPMPDIIRAIRDRKTLGLLADQNARKEGLFVPFFNHLASTSMGPAALALRYKIPILYTHCLRSPADGRYTVRIFPPLHPDPEANRQDEIQRLTQAHVNLLETSIREAPEQYFWFHQRWKTRPKTDPKARPHSPEKI